jgi:4-amino-4-deoxy-L-arabinose transferase-like glycosyltransferase
MTRHTLPVQRLEELGQAHQPPLYYMIAAIATLPVDLSDITGAFKSNPLFMWGGQGGNEINAAIHISDETFPFQGQALALHLVRGVSLLMGMITVMLTIAIGWEIFPDRLLIGLMAGALVAFNPQFLFISGAANNDNLLAMAATGAWWQTLRILKRREQWRQWVYVGVWIAVAILTKLSGLVIGAVLGLILLISAIQRRSLRFFIQSALAITLPVVLITGWWFIRNQMLYGDPLGWTMFQKVFKAVLRDSPLQLGELRHFFSTQFRSFWGVFGWMNVWAPSWFYKGALMLCLLGLLGLGFLAVKHRFNKLSGFQREALIILSLAILAQETFMLKSITRFDASWYQGRYLFPVIGPLMIFLSLGLLSLLPKRLTIPIVSGFVLVLIGIAVFMPFNVIKPAYQIVPLPKWSLWFVPNKTEFTFGDMFELKGYKVRLNMDDPQVSLTLYWQAVKRPDFNYSVFAHLINESNQLVAQKDHAPGEDRGYPPMAWWPGDIIADEHVIKIPHELPPGTYRFRVGVYNWATGEQLPVSLKGKPIGNFVILDQTFHR